MAFGELMAMEPEKNSKEMRTGTSANIEHKRGHAAVGTNGKLFCEEQSPIIDKTSISVPPSSSGNGHSPRVYMSPPSFPNVRNGVLYMWLYAYTDHDHVNKMYKAIQIVYRKI